MGILHRIRRAIARLGDSSAPVGGTGTVGAGLDLGQIKAVEREEFEPDEHRDEERE